MGRKEIVCGLLTALVVLTAGPSHPARAADPIASRGGPLPQCRTADIQTRHGRERSWRRTLVDTARTIGPGYRPHALSPVAEAGISGSGLVRPVVIDDLRAMARAARRSGAAIAVQSAFRSYQYQATVFQGYVDQYGYQAARRMSARPGHSEHQLGTTMDFRSANSTRLPWNYADWAATAAGAWMKHHAWQYGFAMSYPRGKSAISCYVYEPWHYRYFGRSVAARIHRSGLVPRAYLWRTYETAG
ncbi:MAG: zinc D-Ala-D-Ala carboxypeptidase [Chloroflexota bacterium]|jgi:D-alanyl-D-alanine carboxypeptidase|nr:zinc D-Ala-D-Ala carboxypeptidase [Chloroflexota bacterium]